MLPPGILYVETNFNLAGGASWEAGIIDTLDFVGGRQVDFAADRVCGFPFLDFQVKPPGNVNVILQYAVNTTPDAAPTLTWSDAVTVAVAGAAWGGFSRQRLAGRFCRVRVTDTSLAPNNGIYAAGFVRGV